MSSVTVYVSIGNSDDRLPQREWAEFYRTVNLALRSAPAVTQLHGQWVSEPASAWQNACWCVEVDPAGVPELKSILGRIGRSFAQDSVAWAEAPVTVFLSAPGGP